MISWPLENLRSYLGFSSLRTANPCISQAVKESSPTLKNSLHFTRNCYIHLWCTVSSAEFVCHISTIYRCSQKWYKWGRGPKRREVSPRFWQTSDSRHRHPRRGRSHYVLISTSEARPQASIAIANIERRMRVPCQRDALSTVCQKRKPPWGLTNDCECQWVSSP